MKYLFISSGYHVSCDCPGLWSRRRALGSGASAAAFFISPGRTSGRLPLLQAGQVSRLRTCFPCALSGRACAPSAGFLTDAGFRPCQAAFCLASGTGASMSRKYRGIAVRLDPLETAFFCSVTERHNQYVQSVQYFIQCLQKFYENVQ